MSDLSCDICTHAAFFGSFPPSLRGTHCSDCHRSWSGFRESHCAAIRPDGSTCCLHFSADSVAEKHRVGDRCLTRDEMLKHVSKDGKPVFRCVVADTGETWRNAETLQLKPAFLGGSGARIG